jgi:hypothetical protein
MWRSIHRPTWFLAFSKSVRWLYNLRGNPYGHHQPPPPTLLHVKNCLFGSTSAAAPHSTISTFYPDTMVQTPPAGLEVSGGAKHSVNCAAVTPVHSAILSEFWWYSKVEGSKAYLSHQRTGLVTFPRRQHTKHNHHGTSRRHTLVP